MRKAVVTLALLLAVVIGCGTTNEKSGEGFYVVTTTGMIGDLVKNITKGKIVVESLMGPGVDPHLYKASQSDIARLSKADIIFYNGLHLEGKMTDIFEKMARKKKVVAVSAELEESQLISWQNQAGVHDPHIWFDVSLWRQTIPVVEKAISQLDPGNSSFYNENARIYATRLDSLHAWVLGEIGTIPPQQRVMITAHDAFSYFGRVYHVEVHGLQGISTVSEYGVNDVTNLVNLITERGIKAVFIET
ncbi:manganese transporter, partial [candidate division KSB1 bacterium RBG_16_48_16]